MQASKSGPLAGSHCGEEEARGGPEGAGAAAGGGGGGPGRACGGSSSRGVGASTEQTRLTGSTEGGKAGRTEAPDVEAEERAPGAGGLAGLSPMSS